MRVRICLLSLSFLVFAKFCSIACLLSLRGLVQTIFGKISVIVTLGGGGGGGGVKAMTLRKFYCPQVLRNI